MLGLLSDNELCALVQKGEITDKGLGSLPALCREKILVQAKLSASMEQCSDANIAKMVLDFKISDSELSGLLGTDCQQTIRSLVKEQEGVPPHHQRLHCS